MSQTLRDILTPHEVTPPPAAWERIAAELDQWSALAPAGRLLQEAEEPPPPAAWLAIREELENQALGRQLSQLEITPPAEIWSSVEQELAPAERKRPLQTWWRYAAAAVVTGLLVWTGFRLFSENKEQPGSITATQTIKDTGSVQLTDQQARENLAAIIRSTRPPADAPEEVRSAKALEASKKTVARIEPAQLQRKLKNTAAFRFELPAPPPVIDTRERYVVLLTPQGNMIRMSKKLKDMLCCLAGQDGDPACQEQVRKWQDKLINAPGSHAPGNFADLLDMLNALDENR